MRMKRQFRGGDGATGRRGETSSSFTASPRHDSTRLAAGRVTTSLTTSGFTLTEILVVISIMSLLIALAFVVIGDAFGSAKRQATQATVKKVDELLTTRMDAFSRWLDTQGDANIILEGNAHGLAGNNQQLALVLGRKEYFRHYFPQTFSESPTPVSGGPLHNPVTESIECLYAFLTNAEAFGAEPIGEDAFTTAEVKDTDGDGLKEIVDGWGQPLRYYRWPTRVIRTGGYPGVIDQSGASLLMSGAALFTGSPMPAERDPDDQIGLIKSEADAAPMTFPANFENSYHTVETYHAPLIVSAGPDGLIGLYEPNDISNFGYLAAPLPNNAGDPNKSTLDEVTDNITNLNQRAGTGKK